MKIPIRFFLIFLMFPLIFLSSCVNNDFSLGGDNLKSDMKVAYVDTCTVKLSTVQEDSIVTSKLGVAWIGNMRDPYFGSINASSYISFSMPDDISSITSTTVFDSLVFYLKISPDFYGDTTQLQVIKVDTLINSIELNNFGHLYNSDSVAADKNPIGTIAFRPRPHLKNSISIKLPNSKGRDLLNLFKQFNAQTNKVSNESIFLNFLKGFALEPAGSGIINSFVVQDSTVHLKLYCHGDSISYGDKGITVDILSNPALQFNRVISNREGTKISKLSGSNPLSSAETDNETFAQKITGISTEVDFPYINNLQLQGKYVWIESASLSIWPVKGTYTDVTPLPDSLFIDFTNTSDEILATNSVTLTKVDLNYDQNNRYYIDLSSYFKNQLGAFGRDKKKIRLGLRSSGLASDVKRLVFGDMLSTRNPVKLQLKLVIYGN